MRKFVYLVLGLALLVGAGAFFYQRHISVSQEPSSTRSIGSDYFGFDGKRRSSRSAIPEPPKRAMFDRALDVLNLVVGVLGIWFSFSGIRMQRAAAKVIAGREQ